MGGDSRSSRSHRSAGEDTVSESEVESCNAALDRALIVLGDRWTLLILSEIDTGARRFNHIQRNTGMSRDRLTLRLRRLETKGLICRRQYCDHPPRFEYDLAEAGRLLGPAIAELQDWGARYSRAGLSGTAVVRRDSEY
jgi:DNA-binding HxlR family transcriptional regulator